MPKMSVWVPEVPSPTTATVMSNRATSPAPTVIVLGDDAEGVSNTPATCTLAARVRIPHQVENEESGHPDIYVCRDLRFDWSAQWSRKFG